MCDRSLQREQPARLVPPLRLYVKTRERRGFRVAFVERSVLSDRHLAARRSHPERRLLAVMREDATADGDEGVDPGSGELLLHPAERLRILAGSVLHQDAVPLPPHDAPRPRIL